ncbi:S-layer homology domain-containing protein [Sporosarcina gallistercoris]|nr:S-layer homology domain-containing protein [Sporosarcina gallistercoris]
MSDKLFKMTVASAMLTGSIVALAPTAQGAEAVTFKDVSKSMASYEAIMNLTKRGVISGYSDSTFRPAEDVTRGQAAKFIAGIMNLDTSSVVDPKFSDVPKSHPFYKYIAALNKEGVIQGYGNNKFGVNDKLTRAQMAIIIGKAFGFEQKELVNDKFVDVNKKLPYAQYVQSLIDYDITRGLTSTTFGPYNFVDRAQMAIFLHRADMMKDGVEITGNVTSVKDGEVVINKGSYTVSDSVKAILNEKNASALKGAEITLNVKNGQVVSVKSLELNASGTAATPLVFDGAGSTLSGDLKLTGKHLAINNFKVNGTVTIGDAPVSTATIVADSTISFTNVGFKVVEVDSKSPMAIQFLGTSSLTQLNILSNIKLISDTTYIFPSVEIFKGADNVTLDAQINSLTVQTPDKFTLDGNAAIKNLVLATAAPVNIETTGKVDNLLIKLKEALVSLGASTKVGDVKLPAGTDAKDVIKDYDSVKDKIDKVDGEPVVTPTPPVTPPVTPPASNEAAEAAANLKVQISEKLKGYSDGEDFQITVTGNTINFKIGGKFDPEKISNTGLISSFLTLKEIQSVDVDYGIDNANIKLYVSKDKQKSESELKSELKVLIDKTEYKKDTTFDVTLNGETNSGVTYNVKYDVVLSLIPG